MCFSDYIYVAFIFFSVYVYVADFFLASICIILTFIFYNYHIISFNFIQVIFIYKKVRFNIILSGSLFMC